MTPPVIVILVPAVTSTGVVEPSQDSTTVEASVADITPPVMSMFAPAVTLTGEVDPSIHPMQQPLDRLNYQLRHQP
jgi:hypothetical protein